MKIRFFAMISFVTIKFDVPIYVMIVVIISHVFEPILLYICV